MEYNVIYIFYHNTTTI
uniref:Uncharacterized protein n=1 Tax=Anguilla anguilla TaxID=7936 RepID=A0A0E9PG79_ANGAN